MVVKVKNQRWASYVRYKMKCLFLSRLLCTVSMKCITVPSSQHSNSRIYCCHAQGSLLRNVMYSIQDDAVKPPPTKKAKIESSASLDNGDKVCGYSNEWRTKLYYYVNNRTFSLISSKEWRRWKEQLRWSKVQKVLPLQLVIQGRRRQFSSGRGQHYAFASPKSEKPELDAQKVEKLLNCIERRYGTDCWS